MVCWIIIVGSIATIVVVAIALIQFLLDVSRNLDLDDQQRHDRYGDWSDRE